MAEQIRVAFPHTRIENVSNTDRRNYRVSFEKICQQLGFECRIPLEKGIRELQGVLERGIIPDYTAPEYHNQRFLQNAGTLAYANEIDGRLMAAFSAPIGAAVQAAVAGH